jgi:hypothetical protein
MIPFAFVMSGYYWEVFAYDCLVDSCSQARVMFTLSSCLGYMDREEALIAIQEAVELRRQPAADRPAAFNPDLAMSLNNLSICLSNLGHQEEAPMAIQETVKLCRQLAAD